LQLIKNICKKEVVKMLKKEMIEHLKEGYINDKKNTIKQRVLNKVQLVDLVQDKSTKFTEDFSINIKTHGVIDQEHSGRCWFFAGLNILREKVIDKCSYKQSLYVNNRSKYNRQ